VSPTAAEAGKVIVQALEVVLIQYPFPETAFKVAAVTIEDCQSVPPDAGLLQEISVPSDVNT
jgi:hypothetical protein